MALKKYFPIKTSTACKNKWAWSSLYLVDGTTTSCHRASLSDLTPENFSDFHNHPIKLQDRKTMLDGNWPGNGCEYCRDIEAVGETSDRLVHLKIPDNYPSELDVNPQALSVTPSILEVLFNNTCNLSCLYCTEKYSSSIEKENKKFGYFDNKIDRNVLKIRKNSDLVPLFWSWMETNFSKLSRLQVLGGEPLLLTEFDQLLEFIDLNPNPNLELVIITNLIIKEKRLHDCVHTLEQLILSKKIKRVEIQASVDCWGNGQEYIRTGFDSELFESNFNYLLSCRYLKIGILSTVTSLSLQDMPALARKINEWQKIRKVSWYMHNVLPHGTSVLDLKAFSYELYKESIEQMFELLPDTTFDDKITRDLFVGIVKYIKNSTENKIMIQNLLAYLDEIDLRRGLDWKTIFPWLKKYVVQ